MSKKDKKILEGRDYLYLGHPRESMNRIRRWELDFEKRSSINLLNPFYEILRKNREIDINEKDPAKAHLILDDSTVEDELKHIKSSKGMIAIHDGNYTIGVPMEQYCAFNDFKLPVYTLVANRYKNHPWLKKFSSEIFTDREVMEERLIDLYGNEKREVANG